MDLGLPISWEYRALHGSRIAAIARRRIPPYLRGRRDCAVASSVSGQHPAGPLPNQATLDATNLVSEAEVRIPEDRTDFQRVLKENQPQISDKNLEFKRTGADRRLFYAHSFTLCLYLLRTFRIPEF